MKRVIAKILIKIFYTVNKILPSGLYPYSLKLQWWILHHGRSTLNFNNVQTFCEKLQWLKLYGVTPLMTQLVDKAEVKRWVSDKIGAEYVIPSLQVADKFDDIDFDPLPNRFVMKATHGSHMNILVPDKSKFDCASARSMFRRWLKINIAYYGLELSYRNVKPRILVEPYLENRGGDLFDYKFFCFNGKPQYIAFYADRSGGEKHVFFDTQWQRMPFGYFSIYEQEVPRPDNLERMLELVTCLADGFPHARVDFYRLNDGTLKFGEITFFSCGGWQRWKPSEWDLKLGEMIRLPSRQCIAK